MSLHSTSYRVTLCINTIRGLVFMTHPFIHFQKYNTYTEKRIAHGMSRPDYRHIT